MMEPRKKTELLAPAKDMHSAVAAIDHGADAVYMGAPRFGARHAAGNTVEDIARTAGYARRYGARVYVTLNTLLFEDELEQARAQAEEVIAAGADALIVQDMAYMEMGLAGVEFHASTQTFNASPEKVKFLQEAGFSRVILERNLTLEQIKTIRAATSVELEAFVHGAICVCHSGRCYMSRTMGPRSGNRGECSQPCRLTYDLLDAEMKPLVEGKHLLSVQDLDLSGRLGDMLDAGITSFKIEGRLKDLNYVKNTVAAYRAKLDEQLALRPGLVRASAGTTVRDFTPDLSKTFTRGRSEYFFDGKRRGVASFDTPKAVGEYIGKVTAAGKGWFGTDSGKTVSAGDGICFFNGGVLEGTNVNRTEGNRIFPNGPVNIRQGTEVFRNYDHRFSSLLNGSRTRRVIDTSAEITVTAGNILLTVTDEEGVSASAVGNGVFGPANDPVKAEQSIRTQVSRSGDSIFRITGIDIDWDTPRFIPVAGINALRRGALEKLLAEKMNRLPERNLAAVAAGRYPYPSESLAPEGNVTNRLAEKFYRRHGVGNIAPGPDTRENIHGEVVMRTPYCIRRETGRCAKGNTDGNTDLFLRRGTHTYRLRFDCRECIMEVVY